LDHYHDDIISGIPKPFPTPAEREQEELLDTLADEELHLHDGSTSMHEDAKDDTMKQLSVSVQCACVESAAS
jgi:hypothetical protein